LRLTLPLEELDGIRRRHGGRTHGPASPTHTHRADSTHNRRPAAQGPRSHAPIRPRGAVGSAAESVVSAGGPLATRRPSSHRFARRPRRRSRGLSPQSLRTALQLGAVLTLHAHAHVQHEGGTWRMGTSLSGSTATLRQRGHTLRRHPPPGECLAEGRVARSGCYQRWQEPATLPAGRSGQGEHGRGCPRRRLGTLMRRRGTRAIGGGLACAACAAMASPPGDPCGARACGLVG